jgi:hypothetical protein
MKIKKSRLLQIIREEVELHEKNTLIFEEEDLTDFSSQEQADTDGNGKISKKEAKKVFSDEIAADRAAGNLDEFSLDLEKEVDEDQLLTKTKPPEVIPPKQNTDRLEIKIR